MLDSTQGEMVRSAQVFDLPQPKLEVTEYQVIEQKCACGRIHQGQMPSEIRASVQYGAGVKALTVLLSNSCQLSFCKISTLFEDLFGYNLNESTAVSNNKLAYQNLEATEQQIKEQLLKSETAHFDETGLRVHLKNHWLHTGCNSLYTYLFVHEKRGQKAHVGDHSILPDFTGWAIHDCLWSYFKYKKCKHALCGAHLLRELEAQVEQGKVWAKPIKNLLLDLYQRSEKGTKSVPNFELEKQKWLKICREAILLEELLLPKPDSNKKKGKPFRGKALSLLDRLHEQCEAVLAFAQYNIVPFTNNQAERDIRPAKTKIKIAGSFRTNEGAQFFARIQGFLSTCRKHQLNIFNELQAACSASVLYSPPFGGAK